MSSKGISEPPMDVTEPTTNTTSYLAPEAAGPFLETWSQLHRISEGGHNTVYSAVKYGKHFILKALRPAFRSLSAYQDLLHKEFSLGMQVDHPHIVRTLDCGHLEEIGDFIQLEYIDGETLSEALMHHPSSATKHRWLFQLLDAVSYLHSCQIVHRDLKPSNILITRNGSNVKLIDLGISDADDYAQPALPAGTRQYVSPEQLRGDKAIYSSDIWALGKIIAVLFPHRYRAIVRRCTRMNPVKRFTSVDALRRAIVRLDRCRIVIPIILVVLLGLATVGYIGWNKVQNYQRHASQLEQQTSELEVRYEQQQQLLNDYQQLITEQKTQIERLSQPTREEIVRQQAVRDAEKDIRWLVAEAKAKRLSREEVRICLLNPCFPHAADLEKIEPVYKALYVDSYINVYDALRDQYREQIISYYQ